MSVNSASIVALHKRGCLIAVTGAMSIAPPNVDHQMQTASWLQDCRITERYPATKDYNHDAGWPTLTLMGAWRVATKFFPTFLIAQTGAMSIAPPAASRHWMQTMWKYD